MPDGGERSVRWKGRPLDVRPGESLARALARARRPLLTRSIRYHRPRAPACGIGHCTSCLVRVEGRPNVRACRYEPENGERIETENGWPSTGFDLLALVDPIFPGGIDTLHGFRRPAFATPLFQRVVRRLAGFGALADGAPPDPTLAPELRTTDLLVIGGGRSARAFVEALGPRTPPPLLLERGRLDRPIPGAEVRERTTAVFLPRPASGGASFAVLAIEEGGGALQITARAVVVAVGGYDATLWFAGSDRPGVYPADGAEALGPSAGEPPFRRAVVVGGGDRVAALLGAWADRIEAVVGPGPVGPEVAKRASEAGVPIYPRTLLLEARGRRRVAAVRLAARGGGRRFTVACDAVVLAHRRLPNPQLLFQAGAAMEWRGGTGAYYPRLGPGLATTVPGLFAIGEAAGFEGAASTESGRALAAALTGATVPPLPDRVRAEGPSELAGYYAELVGSLPRRAKTIACACEDVLLRELAECHELGYRGIEVAKRYTGLGTGLYQGRYCVPEAILLLSAWEGRPPPEVGFITQRPPVVPAPLGALAGLARPEAE